MGSVRISTSIANAIAATNAATSRKPTPVLLKQMPRDLDGPETHDRLAHDNARQARTSARTRAARSRPYRP
ncbi:hypothetical protein GCM10011608_27710 [Micromonospora sonchi]|uniref:Uncharacterized protein n=1 Tax=Micromonospora sonchi TaxID=1763543 RepID=A0A917TY92_9ACTN|nr:hypothetical protein GCM10011608_27710 [Micromonospora sonchi]